jgi:predicted MFS family arabinose efflux permease
METKVDEIQKKPEIVQHWQILVGCFTGIACGVSSLWFYSMGLFLKPMAAEFGWTRGGASLGPLIGILTLGFISPFVGKVIDRHGARGVALCSLIGLAIGFALLGFFTNGLPVYMTLTLVLALLASASSPISFTRILVERFTQQRGLALGIAITGTGAGAILTPIVITMSFAAFGWRNTYFALALTVLAVIPIIAFFLHGAGSAASISKTQDVVAHDFNLYLSPQFIRLGAIFLLCSLGIFGTIVHIVPMLTDRGLSSTQAASYASMLGIAVIAGRICTGALLDRYEANRLTALLFLLSGFGMGMLATGHPALTMLGTLLAGFAIGAELDFAAYLISQTFPINQYGTAFGGIYACVSTGGGFGPLLAGALFDATGSYTEWLVCAAIFLLAASSLSLLWKWRPQISSPVLKT